MVQPNASVAKYDAYLARKNGRSRPHWWRMVAIRRHEPVRPDQLAEVWDGWVDVHGGDVAAALGALVARHIENPP